MSEAPKKRVVRKVKSSASEGGTVETAEGQRGDGAADVTVKRKKRAEAAAAAILARDDEGGGGGRAGEGVASVTSEATATTTKARARPSRAAKKSEEEEGKGGASPVIAGTAPSGTDGGVGGASSRRMSRGTSAAAATRATARGQASSGASAIDVPFSSPSLGTTVSQSPASVTSARGAAGGAGGGATMLSPSSLQAANNSAVPPALAASALLSSSTATQNALLGDLGRDIFMSNFSAPATINAITNRVLHNTMLRLTFPEMAAADRKMSEMGGMLLSPSSSGGGGIVVGPDGIVSPASSVGAGGTSMSTAALVSSYSLQSNNISAYHADSDYLTKATALHNLVTEASNRVRQLVKDESNAYGQQENEARASEVAQKGRLSTVRYALDGTSERLRVLEDRLATAAAATVGIEQHLTQATSRVKRGKSIGILLRYFMALDGVSPEDFASAMRAISKNREKQRAARTDEWRHHPHLVSHTNPLYFLTADPALTVLDAASVSGVTPLNKNKSAAASVGTRARKRKGAAGEEGDAENNAEGDAEEVVAGEYASRRRASRRAASRSGGGDDDEDDGVSEGDAKKGGGGKILRRRKAVGGPRRTLSRSADDDADDNKGWDLLEKEDLEGGLPTGKRRVRGGRARGVDDDDDDDDEDTPNGNNNDDESTDNADGSDEEGGTGRRGGGGRIRSKKARGGGRKKSVGGLDDDDDNDSVGGKASQAEEEESDEEAAVNLNNHLTAAGAPIKLHTTESAALKLGIPRVFACRYLIEDAVRRVSQLRPLVDSPSSWGGGTAEEVANPLDALNKAGPTAQRKTRGGAGVAAAATPAKPSAFALSSQKANPIESNNPNAFRNINFYTKWVESELVKEALHLVKAYSDNYVESGASKKEAGGKHTTEALSTGDSPAGLSPQGAGDTNVGGTLRRRKGGAAAASATTKEGKKKVAGKTADAIVTNVLTTAAANNTRLHKTILRAIEELSMLYATLTGTTQGLLDAFLNASLVDIRTALNQRLRLTPLPPTPPLPKEASFWAMDIFKTHNKSEMFDFTEFLVSRTRRELSVVQGFVGSNDLAVSSSSSSTQTTRKNLLTQIINNGLKPFLENTMKDSIKFSTDIASQKARLSPRSEQRSRRRVNDAIAYSLSICTELFLKGKEFGRAVSRIMNGAIDDLYAATTGGVALSTGGVGGGGGGGGGGLSNPQHALMNTFKGANIVGASAAAVLSSNSNIVTTLFGGGGGYTGNSNLIATSPYSSSSSSSYEEGLVLSTIEKIFTDFRKRYADEFQERTLLLSYFSEIDFEYRLLLAVNADEPYDYRPDAHSQKGRDLMDRARECMRRAVVLAPTEALETILGDLATALIREVAKFLKKELEKTRESCQKDVRNWFEGDSGSKIKTKEQAYERYIKGADAQPHICGLRMLVWAQSTMIDLLDLFANVLNPISSEIPDLIPNVASERQKQFAQVDLISEEILNLILNAIVSRTLTIFQKLQGSKDYYKPNEKGRNATMNVSGSSSAAAAAASKALDPSLLQLNGNTLACHTACHYLSIQLSQALSFIRLSSLPFPKGEDDEDELNEAADARGGGGGDTITVVGGHARSYSLGSGRVGPALAAHWSSPGGGMSSGGAGWLEDESALVSPTVQNAQQAARGFPRSGGGSLIGGGMGISSATTMATISEFDFWSTVASSGGGGKGAQSSASGGGRGSTALANYIARRAAFQANGSAALAGGNTNTGGAVGSNSSPLSRGWAGMTSSSSVQPLFPTPQHLPPFIKSLRLRDMLYPKTPTFARVLGVALYRGITAHLRSFMVDDVGAVTYQQDVNLIRSTIEPLVLCGRLDGIVVGVLFDIVRETAKGFMVLVDQIVPVFKSGYLQLLEHDEKLQYWRMRADMRDLFKSTGIGK